MPAAASSAGGGALIVLCRDREKSSSATDKSSSSRRAAISGVVESISGLDTIRMRARTPRTYMSEIRARSRKRKIRCLSSARQGRDGKTGGEVLAKMGKSRHLSVSARIRTCGDF